MSDERLMMFLLGMTGLSMLFLISSYVMSIDFITSSRTKTVYTLEYNIPENGTIYDGIFVNIPKNITTEIKISTWGWIFEKLEESE